MVIWHQVWVFGKLTPSILHTLFRVRSDLNESLSGIKSYSSVMANAVRLRDGDLASSVGLWQVNSKYFAYSFSSSFRSERIAFRHQKLFVGNGKRGKVAGW